MVSPVRSEAQGGRGGSHVGETTHPELSGANGRARLVVLACEVGGRWSGECQNVLSQLAKVRHEPPAIRASARHAGYDLLRPVLLRPSPT